MATTTGTTEREPRQHEKPSGSQLVVVDLEEAQSSHEVKRLRRGRGKLVHRVERIVADLVEAGTVKSTAQPVVIVIREFPAPFWTMDDDDDD